MLRELAQKRIAQTVDPLEMFKQQDELLKVPGLQFSVHAVKRVCNCVGNLGALQVLLQLKDIIPDGFDIAMLLL